MSLRARAVAGEHYEVVEPTVDDVYVTFPKMIDDPEFRHLWLLVPRKVPHVPVFKHAPQPSRKNGQREAPPGIICVLPSVDAVEGGGAAAVGAVCCHAEPRSSP